MVIETHFDGNQKKFHHYWLPLIYKHQECEFHVTASRGFTYPKDIANLKVNHIGNKKGPVLKCPMNKVPTYKAMIVLQQKKQGWSGTDEDLGERFYEV